MKNQSSSIGETGKGVSEHKQDKPNRHPEGAVNPRIQEHTSKSWPGDVQSLGHPEGPLAQPPPQGQAQGLCCLYSISQPPQTGWTPANAKLSSLPIPGKKKNSIVNHSPYP